MKKFIALRFLLLSVAAGSFRYRNQYFKTACACVPDLASSPTLSTFSSLSLSSPAADTAPRSNLRIESGLTVAGWCKKCTDGNGNWDNNKDSDCPEKRKVIDCINQTINMTLFFFNAWEMTNNF